jgi:hypothetical protein
MKKIFVTFAMAAFAMNTFAQATQEYWRVEFDMPIVNDGSGKTSVAAGMKDDYTYCNPQHQYLDFPGDGNLKAVGTVGEMGFRSTTSQVNENSAFYLENGRVTWTTAGNTAPAKYPYQVDHITKITAYSIPVEKVQLLDSTRTHEITFLGNNKTYKVSEFTFNRLPRNVAELKTLMEDANGNRVEAAQNPLFVAAVMYLVFPRLLDCSQDCREMIDYLYGTQHSQLQTVGISNQSFQNLCIGIFTDNGGKDYGGGWKHNNLSQHFAGATPGNQYKPNGKDYWTGPYKVRVGWSTTAPTEYSGQMRATVANVLTFPNPDATTKDEISFEDPTAHVVKLRSTNKNGWFMLSNEKTYFSIGKDQYDNDF